MKFHTYIVLALSIITLSYHENLYSMQRRRGGTPHPSRRTPSLRTQRTRHSLLPPVFVDPAVQVTLTDCSICTEQYPASSFKKTACCNQPLCVLCIMKTHARFVALIRETPTAEYKTLCPFCREDMFQGEYGQQLQRNIVENPRFRFALLNATRMLEQTRAEQAAEHRQVVVTAAHEDDDIAILLQMITDREAGDEPFDRQREGLAIVQAAIRNAERALARLEQAAEPDNESDTDSEGED